MLRGILPGHHDRARHLGDRHRRSHRGEHLDEHRHRRSHRGERLDEFLGHHGHPDRLDRVHQGPYAAASGPGLGEGALNWEWDAEPRALLRLSEQQRSL